MSTTEEALDYDPEQVIAHSKDDDGSKPFKLNSHKRVDSRELSQVGAQFRLPTKQTSFPRPPYIDICHDEVAHTLKHSTTGDLGHVPTNTQEQRPADQVRFKDGSPLVPYSDSPLGSHHYSKEDVAILIYHRDKGKSKTAQENTPSESSSQSTRDASPSITEDHDISEVQATTGVAQGPTGSFRSHTPPSPSLTTTNDDCRSMEGDPTPPWSPVKRKRDDLDSGDE